MLLGGYDQEKDILPSSGQDVDLRTRVYKMFCKQAKQLGTTFTQQADELHERRIQFSVGTLSVSHKHLVIITEVTIGIGRCVSVFL